MKLKQLLADIDVDIKGKKDVEVRGLCSHSKKVAPGDLFIARRGLKTDGALFIEDAIQAGAVAIVTDLYNPFLPLTQVIHPDPKSLEAMLAMRFYKRPSDELFLVGITGTNGKTTTSYIVQHVLSSCGLIGTIETVIGERRFPSSLTTPDVIALNRYLREMLTQGCNSCVMEVTSHALVQKRIEGLEFDVGVFTNLSQDHLDYHGTMENYAGAKQLLFDKMMEEHKKGIAIANCDDPWIERIVSVKEDRMITYGITSAHAQLKASQLKLTSGGSQFMVTYGKQEILMKVKLAGRFNVYNCLAAIGVALAKGLPLTEIRDRLATFKTVPGRLQKVAYKGHGNVYIDFAHKEKALESVLQTLQEFNQGKLITVVGCGGDRDKGKRPKMAAVAERYSDLVIFTSDNPRSEDPMHIVEEMLRGVNKKEAVLVELDRKKAIEKALSLAQQGDTVLIAGKGHEMTQTFKDKTIPFSDRTVVEEYS